MRQISEKNTGFFFDPAIPPVLTVESGEIVEFMTKDCYDGQIAIIGSAGAFLIFLCVYPI